MNMHNFPLGPAKPGDGPSPDPDCSASPGQGFIEKNSLPEPNSGCWIWTGVVDSHGYGRACFRGERIMAHRLSWRMINGILPRGVCVCHRCDNPICVNPDHLFIGSHGDNSRDMVRKNRQAFGGKNGNAKLTAADVIAIRSDPRGARKLAKVFGVHRTTIHYVRRKTWRLIGGDNG